MQGEEFLNRLYKDLNLSKEVLHTAKGSKDKNESVKRYMDRLERVHNKVSNREYDLNRLKDFYHRKYCIKEEDLSYFNDDIIKKQEESLDRWIDYLISDGAKYPMWAKYWAFQGMLKIGSFDINSGMYQKRSKKTIAPFVEVDPEILDKCIEQIMLYVGSKKVDDDSLKKIVDSGNFSKLYVTLLSRKKDGIISNSDMIDGVWVKYNYETESEAERKIMEGKVPEYLRLFNSLQGYNTKWCTAGSELTAKNQICGNIEYMGGDFYVYCTKDKNNEYKVPRIAIRMDKENVGEIRGIAEGQNIEDGLEVVVQEKLKDFELSDKEQKKYMKIIFDVKKLSQLYKKFKFNINFTEDDIRFIYELDGEIEGFGWARDQRIREIRDKRNKKDDFLSFNNVDDRIKFSNIYPDILKYIDKSIDNYKKIAMEAVKCSGYELKYVDKSTDGYKEIAMEAVRSRAFAIQYVDKSTDGYKEIAMEAVSCAGVSLQYVDKSTDGYEDIVMKAVTIDANAIQYIDKSLKCYYDVVMMAVKTDGNAIKYVDNTIDNYKKVAMEAVKQNGLAIEFVDYKLDYYKDIAIAAVRQRVQAIMFVSTVTKSYKEIAIEAIKINGQVIQYISKRVKGYKEIMLFAVRRDGYLIEFVDSTIDNYEEIAIEAIKQNPNVIKLVNKKINGYDRLVLLAEILLNERKNNNKVR
ncbi:MAG: DUF4116 domain-containing protein [Bacilli bacterium]|nr:DUF4116 domain-containing protein [Bacilli bacterium]